MKKLFILLGLLLLFTITNAQQPDYHFDGEETLYTDYQSLSTAQRNSMTNVPFGRTIRHDLGGSQKIEIWNGISWVCISCGVNLNLQDVTDNGFLTTNSMSIYGDSNSYFQVGDGVNTNWAVLEPKRLWFYGTESGNYTLSIERPVLSADRTITWQDGSGTIAFLSDISGGGDNLGNHQMTLDLEMNSRSITHFGSGSHARFESNRGFFFDLDHNNDETNNTFQIYANNSNAILSLAEQGDLWLHNYGDGTFTGTPTYDIQVDTNGQLIEVPITGGSEDLDATLAIGNTTSRDIRLLGDSGSFYQLTDVANSISNIDYTDKKVYARDGFNLTVQPPMLTKNSTINYRDGNVDFTGGSEGDVLTIQSDGSVAFEIPSGSSSVSEPINQILFGTGTGVTSNTNLQGNESLFQANVDDIRLLTSDAPLFNSKIFVRKNETNTSGFTATQYAGIDRGSGTGTMWADVIIMNDNSIDANTSGGSVVDFKQLDLENGGDIQYGYGRETIVRHRGSRDVDFLNGHTLRVEVDGTENATVGTVIRNLSSNIKINNPNSIINGDIQGHHNTIDIRHGTINSDIQSYLVDFDFSVNPANYTINGDVSALRMSADLESLVVENGYTKRFLDNRSSIRSDTNGLIFSNASLADHEAASSKVLINRETADNRYLQSVIAGTNITIDNADPANPIINASVGGSLPARVGFAAKNSSTAMSSSSFTDAVFQVEIEDTNSAWDGTTFTVPAGEGGMYEIFGHATFAVVNNGNVAIVGVRVNNSLQDGGLLGRGVGVNGSLGGYGGSLRLNLNAGDEVNMVVYCGNATNLFNTGGQLGYSTFSIYKMR